MIGRMHHVVLDCADPAALATFYSSLLGLPVTYRDNDWVAQQVHLDVMVEEPAAADPRVVATGAVKLDGQDVYADPAGHPFCLPGGPQRREPPGAGPDAAAAAVRYARFSGLPGPSGKDRGTF